MSIHIPQPVRKQDVDDLLQGIQEVEQAFTLYAQHYYQRRMLKKQEGWTFGELDDINDKLRADIIQSRHSHKFLQRLLNDLSRKYKGDALGYAVDSIINEMNRWNLRNVKAKYAAQWLHAFAERFIKAIALGPNFNASPPRQNQLKKIFAQPYESLQPAST